MAVMWAPLHSGFGEISQGVCLPGALLAQALGGGGAGLLC